MSQDTAQLAFIGCGNMAAAIIGGLIAQGYPATHICAADPNEDQRNALAEATGINVSADNLAVAAQADALILAVKPQIMETVVSPLRDTLQTQRPVIISIAAGITVANLSEWLGPDLPIVRTMPNTPALVQTGATGLYANQQVNAEQKALANTVFDAVGITSWFDQEDDLDKVVALSGSGPAYFFMVMEAMENAAVAMGLSPEAARQLTLQTALGSAKLAASSDIAPGELRQRVTSPGGTTEQAIASFEAGDLQGLFRTAMEAAKQRSKELAG